MYILVSFVLPIELNASEGTSQPNIFLISGSSLATMFLVTVLIGVGILIYYTYVLSLTPYTL